MLPFSAFEAQYQWDKSKSTLQCPFEVFQGVKLAYEGGAHNPAADTPILIRRVRILIEARAGDNGVSIDDELQLIQTLDTESKFIQSWESFSLVLVKKNETNSEFDLFLAAPPCGECDMTRFIRSPNNPTPPVLTRFQFMNILQFVLQLLLDYKQRDMHHGHLSPSVIMKDPGFSHFKAIDCGWTRIWLPNFVIKQVPVEDAFEDPAYDWELQNSSDKLKFDVFSGGMILLALSCQMTEEAVACTRHVPQARDESLHLVEKRYGKEFRKILTMFLAKVDISTIVEEFELLFNLTLSKDGDGGFKRKSSKGSEFRQRVEVALPDPEEEEKKAWGHSEVQHSTLEGKVLMLGLDSSGKTTLLAKLKALQLEALGNVALTQGAQAQQAGATVGFNVETILFKEVKYHIWDIGGREETRGTWSQYFPSALAVIYVIDSTASKEQMDITKEVIQETMKCDELKEATLLFFANKSDLPGALNPAHLAENLGLHAFAGRDWRILSTSSISGQGIVEGLEFLTTSLLGKGKLSAIPKKEEKKEETSAAMSRRILMLGHDIAGKSTVLSQLKQGVAVETEPTTDFQMEPILYQNIKFDIWDMPGQEKLRGMWKNYYAGSHGVIFVVDSSEPSRIEQSKVTLHQLAAEPGLKNAAILILVNKMDVAKVTVAEVAIMLGTDALEGRDYHLQGASALLGHGVYDGLDWFVKVFHRREEEKSKIKAGFQAVELMPELPPRLKGGICLTGLDGAGKTTILFQLQHRDLGPIQPTNGSAIQYASFEGMKFEVRDCSGKEKFRPYWPRYAENSECLVYVVDATAAERVGEAKDALLKLLSSTLGNVSKAILLVFVNKIDVTGSMAVEEVVEKLELNGLKDREWHIQPLSALTGDGLNDGLAWLASKR